MKQTSKKKLNVYIDNTGAHTITKKSYKRVMRLRVFDYNIGEYTKRKVFAIELKKTETATYYTIDTEKDGFN